MSAADQPDPLDELTQLGAIGYDDEVNRQAASGPRLGRAGDGHQRSSGANHARRPLPDVAADDIENQIDFADVFQGVVIKVDELLCAEVESRRRPPARPVPMTYAPASRASWLAIEPTTPAAPCTRTLCPA